MNLTPMSRLVLGVIYCLAALSLVQATCLSIPGPTSGSPTTRPSRCWGISQYQVNVTEKCFKDREDALSPADSLSFSLTPQCHGSLLIFLCAQQFVPCGAPATDFPPLDFCSQLNGNCSSAELAAIDQFYITNNIASKFDSSATFPTFSLVPGFNVSQGPIGWAYGMCSPTGAARPMNRLAPKRRPKCQTYTGSVCAGSLPFDVFVPQYSLSPTTLETDQSGVESALKPAQFILAILPVANGCRDSFWKLACASGFPRCRAGSGSIPTLPRFASRALCDDAHAKCPAAFFATSLAASLGINNCSSTRLLNGGSEISTSGQSCSRPNWVVPRFPVTNTSFVSPTVTNPTVKAQLAAVATTTANAMEDSSISVVEAVTCPAPAVKPATYDGVETLSGGSCASPCPVLLWTENEYKEISDLMVTISAVSLFLVLYLLVTFIWFPRSRRNVYQTGFTLAIGFINLSLVLTPAFPIASSTPNVDTPFTRMLCKDNVRPAVMEGFCVVQGVIFVVCALIAVGFWFVQTVDLFLQIQFHARKWRREKRLLKERIFFAWSLGYPLISVTIALGLEDIGNSLKGIAWCFIIDDTVAWTVFYGPIAAQTIIGAFIMLFIIRQLWRTSARMGHHNKRGWWKLYVKPSIFVAVFLFVWGFIFAFRVNELTNEDTYKEDSRKLLTCELNTKPAALALGQPAPDCGSGANPNKALWVMIHVVVSGTGVATFLLYNSFDYFTMWKMKLTCNKDYNFSNTTEESTGTRTSTPRRIHSKRNLTATNSNESSKEKSKEDISLKPTSSSKYQLNNNE